MLIFNSRAAQIRNLAVATVNGAITLMLLLIAPLGLAAVIGNTLLVTIATFATATAADQIVRYLTPDRQYLDLLQNSPGALKKSDPRDPDRPA